MNSFFDNYSAEIQIILSRYPMDQQRSAVMPLLHLAQKQYGFIDNHAIRDIAEILSISTTEVASVVGFYTLFHDKLEGKYRFQICTDLPCALKGAERFRDELCAALSIKPGGTTSDGLITVEEVTCLAACDKAPMFQVQGKDGIQYFENQSVDSALGLVQQLHRTEDSSK
jgi:NADH-quinone oxidoreductase subunit E